MIVAIHQPQYLPWLPYFAKAAACDVFVYLDNVQFQKNGVQNRNQIKTAQGAQWLTVPVNASLEKSIHETTIADAKWPRKHLSGIQMAYARAPHLALLEPLRTLLERPWPNLAELNIAATEWMFERLAVTCRRVRASELAATGQKQDLVLGICRELGATTYLSGQGARAYQVEADFSRAGIALTYHSYEAPTYPQCHMQLGFLPGLSALDLILNAGEEAPRIAALQNGLKRMTSE